MKKISKMEGLIILFVAVLIMGIVGKVKAEPKIRYLEKAIYQKSVEMGVAGGSTGTVSFKNASNNNTVTLKSGVTTSTFTLTLPVQLGTNGQILATDAGGSLYWADDSSATLTNEEVQDIVGAMTTGNTETDITVTYQDADGTIDFVIDDAITRDTEWDTPEEVEGVWGYNIIVSTEIDSEAELEALTGGNNIIISTEINSETKLEGLIGESIWTSGENIDPADVDASGDVKVNRDKKIILDDNSGADTYVTNNSVDDSVSFYLNGTEMFRLEK